MTDTPLLIYRKIPEIMAAVGAIAKSDESDGLKYNYRKIDRIIDRIHPLFAQHGVFVAPQVLEQSRETGQTAKGGIQHWCIVKMRYDFFASDGSSVTVSSMGEAQDSGDKGFAKCQTAALKVALTSLLQIPFENSDPDANVPTWAHEARGGITLRELNELKKSWASAKAPELAGKSKPEMALAFQEFVRDATNEEFAVADWQQWKRGDLEACLVALGAKDAEA